jgi:hypothetical protein
MMGRQMRITKTALSELALLLAFKAALEVTYVLFVYPIYDYMGFTLQLNTMKLLESYLLLLFLFLFLPPGEHRPSAVGIKLLFVMMVVPTLSTYALKDESRFFLYLFLCGFWLTTLMVQIMPRLRIKRIRHSVATLVLGLGALSVVVYVALAMLKGIPAIRLIDLTDVYGIRAEYIQGLPRVMGYLVPWQANVVNCFLIGYTWYKRQYLGFAVALGLQGMLVLISGFKSFLFAPVLVVFLVHAAQKRQVLRLSSMVFTGGIIFSFVFYTLGGSILLPSLFIRRLFFVPAQNYFYYYDFFSKNELLYLSHSILKPFLENPYDMRITNMMGAVYYNDPAMSVNVGYLADAYMNFGWVGVLYSSILLGFFFVLLDSVTRTDVALAVAVIAVPLVSLVNSALFTTLLTHGLFVGVVLLWLLGDKQLGRVRLCIT